MRNGSSGRQVLITGANGFVGAHLAARLMQDGATVHAVVRIGSDLDRFEKLGITPHYRQLDVNDHNQIARAVKEIRPDLVFNLAANRQGDNWKSMIETNLVSAMNLLDACRYSGFCRFVSIGSSLERYDPKTKTAQTAYGANRAAAALLLEQHAMQYGIPLTYLRTDYIYGPLQDTAKLIPTAIHAAENDLVLPVSPVWGKRDYVHVCDIVSACCRAASESGPKPASYNILTGRQYCAKDVVDTLSSIMGKSIRTKTDGDLQRIWDARATEYALPSSGWAALTDLPTGLRNLVNRGNLVRRGQ